MTQPGEIRYWGQGDAAVIALEVSGAYVRAAFVGMDGCDLGSRLMLARFWDHFTPLDNHARKEPPK